MSDDAFIPYPAIDVRDGRVVRLQQGDYDRETRYAEDPYTLAMRYADAGARWLHLVDLDAARAGGYTLAPLLRRIAGDGRLRVQTGGGVRDEAAVEDMLDAGAARVVVGSLAVRDPSQVAGWLRRLGPESITIALDTRRDDDGVWRLPIHGWTERAERDLDDCLAFYRDAGARHLLCTDIARDGMMQGPNLDLYRAVVARGDGFALQASGGVRDAADVAAARDAGCAGAVLGKALLEGRLTVAEALSC
ncbi:MAG: 1-(5-phosphoribosyl)-5-[(5-phosphoribosylamino)methylideneamino]imidazole-4-carboxamide isomerase [Pseudomonadota bacterium]